MRKSGLTGDEAYALSKRRKVTEDLGPLKKEIGLIKEDLVKLNDVVFTEKRNKSQLFNPKVESIGHLYVKSDNSVIENSLSI